MFKGSKIGGASRFVISISFHLPNDYWTQVRHVKWHPITVHRIITDFLSNSTFWLQRLRLSLTVHPSHGTDKGEKIAWYLFSFLKNAISFATIGNVKFYISAWEPLTWRVSTTHTVFLSLNKFIQVETKSNTWFVL